MTSFKKTVKTYAFFKGVISPISLEDSCPKHDFVSNEEALEKCWRSVGDHIRSSMQEVTNERECRKAEKE